MNHVNRPKLNELMNRVSIGDRSAFDPLFEELRPLILRFALKLIQSNTEAEDITQQVLVSIFSRSGEFLHGSDVLSWAFGITAYECKTLRKKVARRKEETISDERFSEIPEGHSFEDSLITSELEKALFDLLEDLPTQDKEAIYASIQRSLKPDIPAATYRKRLERAMSRLKQSWRMNHE